MACFVRLLGPPSVRVGDHLYEPAPSRGSALAFHLAVRGGWVDRGEACALLWPEREEEKARANLRQVLHGLREQPWAVGMEIERSRLRWPVATDLANGAAAAALRDGAGSPVLLDGFRLPDAPGFEAWLDAERAAVAERLRRALLAGAREALEADRPGDALPALDAALRHDPLDEPVLRLALEACRADGRGQEAWARYRAFARRLASELGLEPAPATRDLLRGMDGASRRPAEVEQPALPEGAARADAPSSSARPRRAFVGREDEVAQLAAWLTAGAGVTVVVGPGGIGKTRLAEEAAAAASGRFGDPPRTVRLEDVTDARSAAARIATAVEAPDLGDVEPRDRIVAALAGRRALLVLDNVEQIDEVEGLLRDLAEACDGVAWLATSRRRLALPEGRTLALRGLSTVPRDPDDPASSPAAALFVARAREAGGHVEPDDAEAVAEICRASDGLPLALELAAGWARVLSVAGVARRWLREPALEAPPDADHPERHRTLDRVFDTSWELLGAADRTALLRLTVFHGGCTVEAAQEVADIGLGRLAALRDASMLEVGRDGRVRTHPLVDRYLRRRAEGQEAALAPVRARHAAFYLRFLREEEDRGQREDPRAAVAALQREHGNLEAAWHHDLEAGPYEPFAAGGAHLAFSYALAGRLDTWMALVEEALRRIPRDHLSWAVLEAHHASFDAFLELYERGYRRCRAAAQVARRHDDPWGVGWAVFHHALTALDYGAREEGRAAALEAAELWTRAGEPDLASICYQALHTRELDLDARDRRFEEGERVRAAGVQDGHRADAEVPRALDLAESHGRYGEAQARIGRALAIERRMAWNAMDLGLMLAAAARVRLLAGDLPGARAAADEAVEVAGFLGKRSYFDLRDALAYGAEARRLAGDPEGALARLAIPLPGIEMSHAVMHVVSGRSALDLDRPDEARQAAHAAHAWLDGRAPSRAALATGAELRLLELRLALHVGDAAQARRAAAEALRHADRHRFLPAVLHGLALALPLLPAAEADAARALVAGCPATPHAARLLVPPEPAAEASAAELDDEADPAARIDEAAVRSRARAAREALTTG